METKHINDAMEDKNWVKAMQEELEKFKKNDIWKLVELPQEKKVVRAKYFHVVINWRRRKSMLRDLSIDNLWVKDPVKVKEEVLFFANRFSRNH